MLRYVQLLIIDQLTMIRYAIARQINITMIYGLGVVNNGLLRR